MMSSELGRPSLFHIMLPGVLFYSGWTREPVSFINRLSARSDTKTTTGSLVSVHIYTNLGPVIANMDHRSWTNSHQMRVYFPSPPTLSLTVPYYSTPFLWDTSLQRVTSIYYSYPPWLDLHILLISSNSVIDFRILLISPNSFIPPHITHLLFYDIILCKFVLSHRRRLSHWLPKLLFFVSMR